METTYFVLLLLAAISFFGALLSWRSAPQGGPWPFGYYTFIALGLLMWVLVPLIQTAKSM